MSFALAELSRRFNNIVRLGTIAEINADNTQLRVQTGDIITNWLPVPAHIGHNYTAHFALRVGTQIVLLSPNGELGQAVIVQILYTHTIPSPSQDNHIDTIHFNDGSVIEYDSRSQHLSIKATNKLTITAHNVDIEAQELTVKASVMHQDGDFISQGVSLPNHTHMTSHGMSSTPQKGG